MLRLDANGENATVDANLQPPVASQTTRTNRIQGDRSERWLSTRPSGRGLGMTNQLVTIKFGDFSSDASPDQCTDLVPPPQLQPHVCFGTDAV